MNRKSATPNHQTKKRRYVPPVLAKVYGDLGPDYDTRVLGRLSPAQRDGFDACFIVTALPDSDREHVMHILRAFALLLGGAK